jgi:hypothetical protein
MKSPMNQRPDSEAREMTEEFIAQYARTPAAKPPKAKKPTKT